MNTEQNVHNAVFISYRREGGDTMAQLLNDRLCRMGYKVFYDIDSIRGGDFVAKLDREIGSCTDFIILLSPGVFDRCTDPEDFVRRELRLALQEGKHIIPVFMRGFTFPEKLPSDIKRIKKQDGVIIENMQFLEAKLKELTERMMSVPMKVQEPEKKSKQQKTQSKKTVLIGVGAVGLAAVIFGIWYFSPREVKNMAYMLCETDICSFSYTGRISGSRPDGQGTLNITWENGSVSSYNGNFEKGYPSGTGTYRHSNGESHTTDEWTWVQGSEEDVNDDAFASYSGMLHLNHAYGFGIDESEDGKITCSEWKEGRHFGYGEEIVDDISIRGEYVWEELHILETEDIYAYEGYTVNGEPDYYGTIWYNNNEDDLYSFCGLFVDGVPRYGEYTWHNNKSKFNGYLDINGYPSGDGEFTYVNGNTKTGEWSYVAQFDNVFAVNGNLYSTFGGEYTGMLLNGQKNGYGKCDMFWDIFISDITYLGEFCDGFPNGYGLIYFTENKDNWYLGNVSYCEEITEEMKNNASAYDSFSGFGPMGQGMFVYSNGDHLEGDWSLIQSYGIHGYTGMAFNGVYNGYGSLFYDANNGYCGEFRDGHPSGKGSYWNQAGDIHIDSDQWSWGTCTLKNGTYEGMICGDSITGYGTYTGDKYIYEGGFLDGKEHGCGTRTELDGTSQRGRWENGVLVDEYEY